MKEGSCARKRLAHSSALLPAGPHPILELEPGKSSLTRPSKAEKLSKRNGGEDYIKPSSYVYNRAELERDL